MYFKLTTRDLNDTCRYHSSNRVTLDDFKRDVIEAIKMHDIAIYGTRIIKSKF